MTAPNDRDREMAQGWLAGFHVIGDYGEGYMLTVYDVAKLIAQARAEGAREQREKDAALLDDIIQNEIEDGYTIGVLRDRARAIRQSTTEDGTKP